MPSQPAMPDPARTVQRTVGMCERLGYQRVQALQVIEIACQRVIERNAGTDLLDLTWIEDIQREAHHRLTKGRR